MIAQVRCPSPPCGAVFDIPAQRLGHNIYCLGCGKRMTAKPLEFREELKERQLETQGGPGTAIERLPFVVLLDDIRSLWNVGSTFRTADACGVERLLLTGITGCPPRQEISKTALGAEESVAWSYHADPLEALEEVSTAGYTPVALESSDRAVPLQQMRWPDRLCLVVGNEVAGVSKALLTDCAHRVFIPMGGVKESFNVAVAFGIAAHHAAMALAPAHPEVGFG